MLEPAEKEAHAPKILDTGAKCLDYMTKQYTDTSRYNSVIQAVHICTWIMVIPAPMYNSQNLANDDIAYPWHAGQSIDNSLMCIKLICMCYK